MLPHKERVLTFRLSGRIKRKCSLMVLIRSAKDVLNFFTKVASRQVLYLDLGIGNLKMLERHFLSSSVTNMTTDLCHPLQSYPRKGKEPTSPMLA